MYRWFTQKYRLTCCAYIPYLAKMPRIVEGHAMSLLRIFLTMFRASRCSAPHPSAMGDASTREDPPKDANRSATICSSHKTMPVSEETPQQQSTNQSEVQDAAHFPLTERCPCRNCHKASRPRSPYPPQDRTSRLRTGDPARPGPKPQRQHPQFVFVAEFSCNHRVETEEVSKKENSNSPCHHATCYRRWSGEEEGLLQNGRTTLRR